ncbi:MAG: hypothetical protein LQ348_000588 [Seirophora lacunosa]|nr:MAG: hypothetical protein LQ348_000588 [Seirophora lacunosa]
MTEVFSERNVVSRSSMHEKESLRNALDEYFERYLNLVNEYQLLQRSLAKVLSSVEGAIPQNDWTCTQVLFQGHFSLAQANYSNPARRRYGQDFYDDRMQASTRMNSNISSPPEQLFSFNPILKDITSVTFLPPESKTSTVEQAKTIEDSDTIAKDSEPELGVSDPLKWFGILVPQALRACQASFKHAVEELIPSLTSVSNEMKSLEIEIRRTRKKIRKAG